MNKISNIAIVGLGQIGLYLYNELKTQTKLIQKKTGKTIKIVGISDKNKKKLLFFSKQLNVPGFLDFKKGIQNTNPDIVSILTPSGNHASHIMGSLKLKKHVFNMF